MNTTSENDIETMWRGFFVFVNKEERKGQAERAELDND